MIVTIVTMTVPIFTYIFVKFDLKDLEGVTLTVRPKGVRSTVKSQGNESKNIKRSGENLRLNSSSHLQKLSWRFSFPKILKVALLLLFEHF